jgi:hypothetical protein
MELSVTVKNTFVYAVSVEKTNSAGEGLRRSCSCPSLAAPRTTSPEHENSDDSSAVAPLASLGDWADLETDSDEEFHPSCLSSVGLGNFGLIGKVDPAPKVSEKTPLTLESVLVHASQKERTPLSGKASAFVPFIPLNSKASAFVPRSPQTVSESPASQVPDIKEELSPEPHTTTTVMLRNLPRGYTRKDLVRTLNKHGFAGLYDFVYMPFDFKIKQCMGYAFVNMTASEHVQHVIERFDGQRLWPRSASLKLCAAGLSHTQGLEANIERFRNSPVMGDEVPESFKPAIFVGDKQVPFPKPTRELPPVHP